MDPDGGAASDTDSESALTAYASMSSFSPSLPVADGAVVKSPSVEASPEMESRAASELGPGPAGVRASPRPAASPRAASVARGLPAALSKTESKLVGLKREDSVVRFAGEVALPEASTLSETPSRRPSHSRQHSEFNAIVEGTFEEHQTRVAKRNSGSFAMLHPASRVRIFWDLQMLVFVVYVALLFPYYMGFNTEATGGVAIFEAIIDYLFIADLVLNFRTGYVDRNGIVVLDGWRVCAHYLRTWFCLDFVSSFPLELLLGPAFRNLNAAKLLKIGKLFKALKMLRIGKLAKITQESGMTETFEEFMVSAPANALVNLFKVIGSCALL